MIRVEDLAWQAGKFRLEHIHFEVASGAYAVLMGRTGTGKTTLLELICGLRKPLAGRIYLRQQDVTRLPPAQRKIGFVPQDSALFPSMTVAEQIGFALKLQGRSAGDIREQVERLAVEMHLEGLLERKPQGLSGGEKQRTALARALAAEPEVLLMDEPLGALDEQSQEEMIALLQSLHGRLGFTALHITHSRREAERLAQQLLRLENHAVHTE